MKRFLYLSVCIIAVLFVQCNNPIDEETNVIEDKSVVSKEGMIVLGKKLENPYSIENMKRAYESLNESGELKSKDIDLKPTHLYIRFLPKDGKELDILWGDKSLELFDYPLDYEIVGGNTNYRDPSIPEGKPGWLYTVVPVKSKLPKVEYEVLAECIIPDIEEVGLKSTNENELLLKIEHESLRLTNNLKEDNTLKSSGSCKPKGYIMVTNTHTGLYDGVMKIKVRVRSWLRVDAVYTNEDGFYQMEENFSSDDVKYDLVYENETGFKIWDYYGFASPIVYWMGDHPKEGYNQWTSTGSVSWIWNAVNNGAYIYRTQLCPAFGVAAPPSEIRIWTLRDNSISWNGSAPMARQLSLDWSTLSNFITAIGTINGTAYISLVLPDIFIAKDFKSTYDTYSTLFHELAHASHFTQADSYFWRQYINGIVANSGVGKGTYGDGTGSIDGYIGVGEMWGNFFGYKCMQNQFGSVSLGGTSYWFAPTILQRLSWYDITPQQIFNCQTSDVNNHQKLKTKIISNHGQPTIVTKIFSDYGF